MKLAAGEENTAMKKYLFFIVVFVKLVVGVQLRFLHFQIYHSVKSPPNLTIQAVLGQCSPFYTSVHFLHLSYLFSYG